MNPEHKKYEPQICGVARKFHRRFGGDFADIRQSAWAIFLECAKTHNPARGILETRIEYVIYHRLLDQRRADVRRQNRERGRTPPANFDRDKIFADLSADAAAILNAIFSVDPPAHRVGKRFGRGVAIRAGFSPKTICAAFAEIEAVL